MRRLWILALLTALGCQRGAVAPTSLTAPDGPASGAGWEVRYNAALALARRGSPKVSDPSAWETLREILDEKQQLRNFRIKLADGREVSDVAAAREAVKSGLQALGELHRKRPELDLSAFKPSVTTLVESPREELSREARQARITLGW